MKNLKMVRLLTCGILSLLMCSVANAKTEKITLKRPIDFGGEAVIFNTTKGEVILNLYALPVKVAEQLKPYKRDNVWKSNPNMVSFETLEMVNTFKVFDHANLLHLKRVNLNS